MFALGKLSQFFGLGNFTQGLGLIQVNTGFVHLNLTQGCSYHGISLCSVS